MTDDILFLYLVEITKYILQLYCFRPKAHDAIFNATMNNKHTANVPQLCSDDDDNLDYERECFLAIKAMVTKQEDSRTVEENGRY